MMIKYRIYLSLIWLNIFNLITANHFYGGSITWTALDRDAVTSIEVLVNHRFYWKSTHSSSFLCNDARIASGFLIGENTNIVCRTGCSPNAYQFDSKVNCSSYSLTYNWSSGQRSSTITLSSAQLYTEASFTGGNWLPLVSGGGSWEVRFKMNLTKRSDIQKINSPPVSLTSPITNLRLGCMSSIKIPILDPDNDRVKCRWAVGNECAGICSQVAGAVLFEENCTFTFQPNSIGYYAVALQIEDYSDQISATTPLSSIPLQFLLYVQNKPCVTSVIYFDQLTYQQSECIGIEYNITFTIKIIIYSTETLKEVIVLGPTGLKQSNIDNYNNNSSMWYVNVTWTPNDLNQIGTNLFCFQGVNILDDATEQRCIHLLVTIYAPIFLNPSPIDLITLDPVSNIFQIESNMTILKTSDTSYIRVFNQNLTQIIQIDASSSDVTIINKNKVQFAIPSNVLAPNESYYILFDFGVAVADSNCGVKSRSITNTTFWTFRIEEFKTTSNTNAIDSMINGENISKIIKNPNSSICDLTNGDWLIISLIIIGLLILLVVLLSTALCIVIFCKNKKLTKVNPLNKKPILVKSIQNNDELRQRHIRNFMVLNTEQYEVLPQMTKW